MVRVQYGAQVDNLLLIVIKGNGSSLFGRNWLEKIYIDWGAVKTLVAQGPLDELLQKHEALFQKELGTLKGIQAKLKAAPAEAKLNWSSQVRDCVVSTQQCEVLQGPTLM